MRTVILIPARYASTRYPGKPLVELKGCTGVAKPLIQRSVEAARQRAVLVLDVGAQAVSAGSSSRAVQRSGCRLRSSSSAAFTAML